MQKRILLVDDEPVNLMLLEAILTPLGAQLFRATNGVEALDLLEHQRVDLVLLDMMMPRMDGIETVRRIRARQDWARFPIVLVTAAHERDARLQGFKAGADEFLEKPIDRPLLMTRVQTLLKLHEAQQLLAERAHALEVLHAERRELVNLIVHDLKNPLSVIYSNVRYLQKVIPAASMDSDDALQDAAAAAERMNSLISDILNVERMDQAALRLRRQEVNVATLVAEVARAHHRTAKMQDLQVSTELKDVTVRADPDLVRRVLENLIENALRHTPSHGVIELKIEPGQDIGVVVSNTGQPIPADLRDTLFAKFVRGDGNSKGRFGLGLYFCKMVAAAHEGSLALVERAGWPVSFRFGLPAA